MGDFHLIRKPILNKKNKKGFPEMGKPFLFNGRIVIISNKLLTDNLTRDIIELSREEPNEHL